MAVENSTYTTGRRGVAGTLIVEKIVGAAAERGDNLAELKALGDAVNKATASMGVALTSCTVPAAGKPTFQIGADEMEMGVGIHGEPGRRRVKLSQRRRHRRRADRRDAEGPVAASAGQEVILLVNGFGGTPLLELYVMVDAAQKVLAGAGVQGGAPPDRLLRHLAGDGGLLDHRHRGRRRHAGAVGRAGAHGGVALGRLTPGNATPACTTARGDEPMKTLIRNCVVWDGSGAAPFAAEVLVEGERIARVAAGAAALPPKARG